MRLIAHLSDLHFGTAPPWLVEALLADLHAVRPSVVVVSGDFTQRARTAQFAAARAFLDRLPAPCVAVPGNHDIPLLNPLRRLVRPLRRYRRAIGGAVPAVLVDAELAVIGMNTARRYTWKSGAVSARELGALEHALADLPGRCFKVVVTHHPLVRASGARRADVASGGARALAVLERCGVELLLSGHLHRGGAEIVPAETLAGGALVTVQAGTATSTRRREAANAYNLVGIAPGELRCAMRQLAGARFVAGPVTTFTRRDGRWAPEQADS